MDVIKDKAKGPNCLLSVQNISLHFGGIKALTEVNLSINEGELYALIGPNGAGKTSLVNCISRLYKPQKGRILFGPQNADLTRLRPHQVAGLGIARAFQNVELFKNLSALDNMLLGRHGFMHFGAIRAGLFMGKAKREELAQRKKVEEIIDFLEIEAIRKTPVGILPYGLKKKVELGRALCMEPKLLILDEPTTGMNVEEKEDMVRYILDIKKEMHTTIMIIEHDMRVVMDICQRIGVLDFGLKIAEGTPEEIKSDPVVIQAYLGEI